MAWFVLYVERKPHGKPCQQWAENVFLHDRVEICESEVEATKLYEQITKRDSTHTARMGQMKLDHGVGYQSSCGNCGHHWAADQYQESCPKCQSWHVMTTDEWSEHDAFNGAIEEMEQVT